MRTVGLGKGKPFCASKIAKKKLGLSGMVGRPKGIGKGGSGLEKVVGGYQKRQRRPQADASFTKTEEEPGVENRLVLCSAKDKFVLTQDICVMCGAIGIDQEGCLIACAQCGQCYHPYCVNVKVTKVILQKGWRCLDCTVCEGCGQRNDEGRLILCDDCDISYHIYCMDPPLDYVPHGNWKCKWWLHCMCDQIRTEAEAERCAEDGYNCVLCRPRDVPPPHLQPQPPAPKPPTPTKSPDIDHDGIKLELDDSKEDGKLEPVEVYKEGIGGFNARLRNTRNKEKDEEGGGDAAPGTSTTPTSAGPTSTTNQEGTPAPEDKPRRKPNRRKPKNKLMESYPSYLQEAFFGRDLLDTTKEKDMGSSCDSDEERASPLQVSEDKLIQLSQDELKAIEEVKAKQEKETDKDDKKVEGSESGSVSLKSPGKDDDEGSDTEGLKDILPNDLLDTDLVNTIMNEDDDITKSEDNLEDIGDPTLADDSLNDSLSMPEGSGDVSGTSHKDELDIFSPNFNLESMVSQTGLPNMDCKDVEEIFKGVLTDESQESQESVFPLGSVTTPTTPSHGQSVQQTPGKISPSGVSHPALQQGVNRSNVSGPLPSVGQSNLSPISFPPPSPYHSEYSNSPFSEPPSPWLSQVDVDGMEGGSSSSSGNRQSNQKMEADEALGSNATISSVLYANMKHPEWKKEFPLWNDRHKQILKTWRALPTEMKAPFLQQARENRAALRMKKAQQVSLSCNNLISSMLDKLIDHVIYHTFLFHFINN
ncbi:hypothetical protein C0J52_04798 [Blattella germanica]|nr:hypothetical protein C0J52_04798 [Blattella germanica]